MRATRVKFRATYRRITGRDSRYSAYSYLLFTFSKKGRAVESKKKNIRMKIEFQHRENERDVHIDKVNFENVDRIVLYAYTDILTTLSTYVYIRMYVHVYTYIRVRV